MRFSTMADPGAAQGVAHCEGRRRHPAGVGRSRGRAGSRLLDRVGRRSGRRYTVLALSAPGLVLVAVRVNVPQEGPRTSGKLIRWNRVQTGELAMEIGGGPPAHQLPGRGPRLRGSDAEADEIAGVRPRRVRGDGRPATSREPHARVEQRSAGSNGPRAAEAGREAPASPAAVLPAAPRKDRQR